MKNILLSSAALILFAIAIITFQLSCKKETIAQTNLPDPAYQLPPATTTTLGGVIPDGTTIKVDTTGKISTGPNINPQLNKVIYAIGFGTGPNSINPDAGYWIMSYDGTNRKKLPITFLNGYTYSMFPSLSPDGKTIFFTATDNTNRTFLYSCAVSGGVLRLLLTQSRLSTGMVNIEVGGVY